MQKFQKPLPSTVKTEQPKPNKPIFAPNIDPNFDFTGYVREKLPYWVLKAAKHGAVQSHVIVGKIECTNCKRFCWSCDAKLEDTCEECDYIQHEENRDLTIARSRRQMQMGVVNPFAPRDDE